MAQEAGPVALPQAEIKEVLLHACCLLWVGGGITSPSGRTRGLGARQQGRKEVQKEEEKGAEASGKESGGWTGTRWGLAEGRREGRRDPKEAGETEKWRKEGTNNEPSGAGNITDDSV